jgi:uncharacterized protein (DUF2141 family)
MWAGTITGDAPLSSSSDALRDDVMAFLTRVGSALLLTAMGGPSWAGDLTVAITGVHSRAGTLMIGLYDTPAGFDKAIEQSTKQGLLNDPTRVAGVAVRAVTGTQSMVFKNLEPGTYAIIVFHDENDNGMLDENYWGVPTEGYAFSNNAQGLLGAPNFDAAAVVVDNADKAIEISLIYPTPLPALSLITQ